MKVVLDAGALVAIERRDRRVGAMLRLLQQRRIPLASTAPVVAQVWRDGAKQALLAKLLDGVEIIGLNAGSDRQTGELLARTRTSDVVDGHLVLALADGDQVVTSDPDDLQRLVDARGVEATIVTA